MTTQYAGIYNPANNTPANRALFLSLLQNDPEISQYQALTVVSADAGYTMQITFTNPVLIYKDMNLIQYIADLNFNGVVINPNYAARTTPHSYLAANANHDSRLGYSIGSVMSFPGELSSYICYDNTATAAVWKKVCVQSLYFNTGTGISDQDFIKLDGFTATESEAQYLINRDVLINNLSVKVVSGAALDNGSTITLRVNGIDTALVVTGDGTTDPLTNTSDIVSVSSLDLISVRFEGTDTGKIFSVTLDQI